jgi:hypothetical protein
MTMPRTCVWCQTDISAPGAAFPIMYARIADPDGNWHCADDVACEKRANRLCAEVGVDPAKFGRSPVARLMPGGS